MEYKVIEWVPDALACSLPAGTASVRAKISAVSRPMRLMVLLEFFSRTCCKKLTTPTLKLLEIVPIKNNPDENQFRRDL